MYFLVILWRATILLNLVHWSLGIDIAKFECYVCYGDVECSNKLDILGKKDFGGESDTDYKPACTKSYDYHEAGSSEPDVVNTRSGTGREDLTVTADFCEVVEDEDTEQKTEFCYCFSPLCNGNEPQCAIRKGKSKECP